MAQVLRQLIAGGGYGQNQGGLPGLINQFSQAGLGHVADSWVSNGPNRPVSPDQLRQVFGHEQVETMADDAGSRPTAFFRS